MIEKKCTIPNLPIGTGAAIGSFIRSLYLTASTRPAIIGINVDGLGFFDTLGANSAMVSDLIIMLIGQDYAINPAVLTEPHIVAKDTSLGTIYSITVTDTFSKAISREHFSNIFTGVPTEDIKLLEPVKLSITFYICEITGVASENIISAVLHELPVDSTFLLPVSCSGKHISKFWSTYSRHKFNEDLTLHIEGPDEQTVDADLEYIRNLYSNYVINAADCMASFQ